jgi:hypothetical protein
VSSNEKVRIQDELVCIIEAIPHIWSTNYYLVRNEVLMDQLIPFRKPNNKNEEWEDDENLSKHIFLTNSLYEIKRIYKNMFLGGYLNFLYT